MAELDLSALDPEEIGKLMRLLAGTDVEECEVQQGGLSISLRRAPIVMTVGAQPAEQPAREQEDSAGEPLVVPSPAVGVFYRGEQRSSEPAAQDGSRVKVGDTLGVVEVIGVPHPVQSTGEGLVSFLLDDGQAVEYGQPIAAIGRES